jgi:hypothetical protein
MSKKSKKADAVLGNIFNSKKKVNSRADGKGFFKAIDRNCCHYVKIGIRPQTH